MEIKVNCVDRNDTVEAEQPHHLSIFAKAGKPIGKVNFKQLAMKIRNWLDFLSQKIVKRQNLSMSKCPYIVSYI